MKKQSIKIIYVVIGINLCVALTSHLVKQQYASMYSSHLASSTSCEMCMCNPTKLYCTILHSHTELFMQSFECNLTLPLWLPIQLCVSVSMDLFLCCVATDPSAPFYGLYECLLE